MEEPMNPDGPIRVETLEDGAYWRVVLGGSKGNIIDIALTEALTELYHKAGHERDLKAVCLEGEGKHFSFGASVPEHLPEKVDKMLPAFHELFRVMANSHVTTLAAVRGQCLGGALEVVSFCHRIFASEDAKLGQPEIVLGVLAPVASMILTDRIGRANTEDICLTGRVVGADEAKTMGLVDEITANPGEAALAWAKENLMKHSAASLRYAVKAVRTGLRSRLATELGEIERIYLEELMSTHDATEGITSFLEKRKPEWTNE
jgi:cyclohexa-1,5-dienecarbonyl-CoA hydratase